jgi:hypothetical protein
MKVHAYDVFVSYRRPQGANAAGQVEAALKIRGIRPLLDLADLSRGHFDFPLLKRVAEIPSFVVVLTPGALDRCHDHGDWLCQEIGQALKSSRTIIPLVVPGFTYPVDLPRELHGLTQRESLECSLPLSEPAVVAILEAIEKGNRRQRQIARRRTLVVSLVGVAVLIAASVGLWLLAKGGASGWELVLTHALTAPVEPARLPLLQARLTGARGTANETVPPDQRVTYQGVREPAQMHVIYRLPYLERVRQGGAVAGLAREKDTFSGEMPELIVDVHNGTDRKIGLATSVFKVDFSRIVTEPIPVFEEMSPASLRITNQGWVRIELPTFRFSFSSNYDDHTLAVAEVHTVSLPTIADHKSIPLREFIPAELNGDPVVKITGTMQYGEATDRRALAFSTIVRNDDHVVATTESPPLVFNTFLPAGQTEPVIVDLESTASLEPGDTATYVIRVHTDRSSAARLSVNFVTAEGTLIRGEPFLLDMFVPRFSATRWTKAAVKRPAIRSEIRD